MLGSASHVQRPRTQRALVQTGSLFGPSGQPGPGWEESTYVVVASPEPRGVSTAFLCIHSILRSVLFYSQIFFLLSLWVYAVFSSAALLTSCIGASTCASDSGTAFTSRHSRYTTACCCETGCMRRGPGRKLLLFWSLTRRRVRARTASTRPSICIWLY